MLYVFIVTNIGGIGGQQIYLDCKVRHLRQRGWRVAVLSSFSGEPAIETLKEFYPAQNIGWLRHRYSTLTRRQRQRALMDIERLTEPEGRVVIESYTCETAIWGEALAAHLAQRMEASHFCYLLTEYPPLPAPGEAELLRLKRRQGLLRSIDAGCLHRMLPEVPDGEGFLFPPTIAAVNIDDVPLPGCARSQSAHDMRLLTVARLEKPYVIPMLREIKKFAAEMWSRSESVSLVIIGDVSGRQGRGKRLQRRLRRMLHEAPGLDVQWWGTVWPAPREAYRQADVFIGVSGALQEAAREGVACISLDSADCQAIGIYGEQTSNSFSRSSGEPPIALSELLMDLRRQRDLRRDVRKDVRPRERRPDFHIHDLLADNAVQSEYFPVDTLSPKGLKGMCLRLLNRVGLFPLIDFLKRCI